MGTEPVRRGATADTVSDNVKQLRLARNLGLRAFADKLAEIGWPLNHSAIDKIEKGTRRVDVDDLTALAAALEVTPATLLCPKTDDPEQPVALTGIGTRTAGDMAMWLRGDHAAKAMFIELLKEVRPEIAELDNKRRELIFAEDLARRVKALESRLGEPAANFFLTGDQPTGAGRGND